MEKKAWRWRKWLAWIMVVLVIILASVAAAIYFGIRYLASAEVKRFQDVIALNGADIQFRSLKIGGIWNYPHYTLELQDLLVHESGFRQNTDSSPDRHPALLRIDELRIPITVDLWMDFTGTIHNVYICGGELNIHKEADGQSNLSKLFSSNSNSAPEPESESSNKDSTHSRLFFVPGGKIVIEDFDGRFHHPVKGTDISGKIISLRMSDLKLKDGFAALADLHIAMNGMQFKASNGSFLEQDTILGPMQIDYTNYVLKASSPQLDVGGNKIEVDLSFYTRRDSTSVLRFAMDSSNVDRARTVLSPKVRKAIAPFDVKGSFPSLTTVLIPPKGIARVEVALFLPNNKAIVNKEIFTNTYLKATFISVPADTTNNNKGIQFVIDTVSTLFRDLRMVSHDALITSSIADGTNLRAEAHIEGPASAISRWVKSDQFIFRKGQVVATAQVNGPPEKVMQLIDQSSFDATIRDAVVRLAGAQASLSLKQIHVGKTRDTVDFQILGRIPNSSSTYKLVGELEGLASLLGIDSFYQVKSRGVLTATKLAWTDIINVLGEVESKPNTDTSGTKAQNDLVRSFKAALSEIQKSFQPKLDIKIDTLSYYGLVLSNFTTGMHFRDAQTVILEKTKFDIGKGEVALDGMLGIGQARRTPVELDFRASHLDLEKILPPLDYFGLTALKELNSLPNDINATIKQKAEIDELAGLVTDNAVGSIRLVSNKIKPFEANIEFEEDRPDIPDFKSTRVDLTGSPELFNDFFETENFFFKDGTFHFQLGYSGLLPDLKTLVDQEAMQLCVSDVGIRFVEAGFTVPVQHLDLDLNGDIGQVELLIKDDDLGQEILATGTAVNVSEVVIGGTGKHFSSDLQVSSPLLVWNDLSSLIVSKDSGEPRTDTTTVDTSQTQLNLRKTIRAVMNRFDPIFNLDIDRLELNNQLAIDNLVSGFAMDEKQILRIDTTGFSYLNGAMMLYGSIDLADLSLTPFQFTTSSDSLNVGSLLEGFDYFDIAALKSADRLEGRLSLSVDMAGAITGGDTVATLFSDSTRGTIQLKLTDLVLEGLKAIDQTTSKFLMKDRYSNLRFAPIISTLEVKGNKILIPLTEVQSNALNVFIEGSLELNGPASIWISIPLSNVFVDESRAVPPKRGYADTRFRFHIQMQAEAGEPLKPKFRLSKRRYYEEKYGEGAWKAAKRELRAERKRARKANKAATRE